MQLLWFFTALAALVAPHVECGPVSLKATALEQEIAALLTQLQAIVPTGSAALGVPVLDPLALTDRTFTVQKDGADVTVAFTDADLTGLNNVKVVSIIQNGEKVTVVLSLASATSTGSYTSSGTLNALSVSGSGEYTATVTGLTATAVLGLSEGSDGSVSLASTAVDYTFDSISVKVDGLDGGAVLDTTVSALLSTLAVAKEQVYHSDIVAKLATLLSSAIQVYLNSL